MATATEDPSNNFHGTTTFFNGEYTAVSVTITICCAIALYNVIELLISIFATFRKYSGLYFWSLLVATSGIIPYVIGFLFEYFELATQLAGEIVATIGWPMMVSGQSLVLYSRLGVVLGPNRDRLLRAVKWMIIIDGLIFHISTTVVMFGAYNAHPARPFALAYRYVEKIQMTGFTVQEFIISSLYVWCTLEILKTTDGTTDRNRRRRRTMIELFSVNATIIILDIALLVVEYQNRHVIEQAVKCLVYSVKLKLEFPVLRNIINMSQQHMRTSQNTFTTTTDDIVETRSSVVSNGTYGSIYETKNKNSDDIFRIESV